MRLLAAFNEVPLKLPHFQLIVWECCHSGNDIPSEASVPLVPVLCDPALSELCKKNPKPR